MKNKKRQYMKKFIVFLAFVILPLSPWCNAWGDDSCETKLEQEIKMIIDNKATSANLDILKDSDTAKIKESYNKELATYYEKAHEAGKNDVGSGSVLTSFTQDLAKLYCPAEQQETAPSEPQSDDEWTALRADAQKVVTKYKEINEKLSKTGGK